MTDTASPLVRRAFVDVPERLSWGLARQRAGDLDAAEAAYREVLDAVPDHAEALHLLGTICIQRGECERALEHFERAIALGPADDRVLVNLGVACQKLTLVERAEESYRRALAHNPANAAALANLGVLLREDGRPEEALRCLEEARRLDDGAANVHKELGLLHFGEQRFEEAARCYERYLALDPTDVSVVNDLGIAYARLRRYAEAERHFRRAYEAGMRTPDICNNMGNVLRQLERNDEAEKFVREALEQDPGRIEFQRNLALVFYHQGRIRRAFEVFERLWHEGHKDMESAIGLAAALTADGRLSDAEKVLLPALEKQPDDAEGWYILGGVYYAMHDNHRAEKAYRRALEADPQHPGAHLNLCSVLRKTYRFDEANAVAEEILALPGYEPKMYGSPYQAFRLACNFEAIEKHGHFLSAMDAMPARAASGSFLLAMIEAEEDADIQRLVDAHRRWGETVEANAREEPLPPLSRPRRGGSKIRVGFVSSDLRSHSVAKYLLPLFRHYDANRLEFHCYSSWEASHDPVQQEIRDLVTSFNAVMDLSNRALAATIRDDDIDILIDMNGHTDGTRLEVFAYRPAPVQISWLGYPFTTGLSTMDYVLVDEETKPTHDGYLVEQPLCMPECCMCFGEYPDEPIADTLPVERNGHITFGTLNNPYKFTPQMIATWARVIDQVPGSRFMFVRPQANSLTFCASIIKEFGKHGVDAERLNFYDNHTLRVPYLACYNEIDISLDTFPLTGGTTTCDALWMGVPIVTLVGPATHQRLSYSVLKQIRLDDLAAFDRDDFIRKAVDLANNVDALAFLRHHLRPALLDTVLCDSRKFAAHFADVMMDVARKHGLR